MNAKLIAPVLIIALAAAACTPGREKEEAGTLVGAGAGAAIGSMIGKGGGNIAAIVIGGLLGGYLGNTIGRQLDDKDRMMHEQAAQQALAAPVGQTINWNNPNNGHSGTVTTVRDGTDQAGAYCREYQQTVVVGGQSQQAYGTACRQPDGSWKIVSQQ
ncbi:MAG TPA: RT0821/Lpp0805 family surface protein [Alphaproteobacteria bacterium]|nr:RT0821/Lpp0805 family surface protein [Alphaproteobacteria bacterium]